MRCEPKTLTLALLTAIALGALSACASEVATDLDLPAQNRANWVMPADPYLVSEEVFEAVSYAELLVDFGCLAKAGYPDPVPFKDVSTSWQSATWNAVGVRLFGEAIAGRHGYHLAGRQIANPDEWRHFYRSELSAAASIALEECRDNRDVDIPDVANLGNELAALRMAADERAQQSSAVTDAAARWRECMAPLGIPDLGDSPLSTPTQSQNEAFDIVAGSLTAAPSAEEIAQASSDAACEESSGYAEAYYQASWDENLKVLQENLETFERARSQFADAYETALTIIAERAPSN